MVPSDSSGGGDWFFDIFGGEAHISLYSSKRELGIGISFPFDRQSDDEVEMRMVGVNLHLVAWVLGIHFVKFSNKK